LSVQRASVSIAKPHAEKWLGACCGSTRRARSAGPADRRGARVPGGLDQQRGSAGAAGSCADPDSFLWQAFAGGDWCSGAPESHLAYASGVAHAFDGDCFCGPDGDSSGDHEQRSEADGDRQRVREVRIVKRSDTTRAEEIAESEQFARAEDDAGTSDAAESSLAVPEAWRNKGFRLCVIATAFILAAGLSFGVGRVFGLGDTAVHSAIPAPLKGEDIFVEDPDGIARDNQSNITEYTGQGMVHVLSGGTSVGIGLVLTQSGKVLTTYQPSAGAANLAAEYVYSRETFKATVIGVDPAAGLALLQMEGSNGRAFSTVTVGNSATAVGSARVIRQSSYHVPGEVVVTAVSTTGREDGVSFDVGKLIALNTTVTLGGVTWTGLMASVLPSAQPPAIGGPLANPNGHVIGIIAGSSGSGINTVGYAIPINGALSVATQIADGNF
jgi:S1-C subfamily serine protease